jgi:hypothetical protein
MAGATDIGSVVSGLCTSLLVFSLVSLCPSDDVVLVRPSVNTFPTEIHHGSVNDIPVASSQDEEIKSEYDLPMHGIMKQTPADPSASSDTDLKSVLLG